MEFHESPEDLNSEENLAVAVGLVEEAEAYDEKVFGNWLFIAGLLERAADLVFEDEELSNKPEFFEIRRNIIQSCVKFFLKIVDLYMSQLEYLDPIKSLDYYQSALKFGFNKHAMINLGLVYANMGRANEARETWQIALKYLDENDLIDMIRIQDINRNIRLLNAGLN